jgi:DNA/RNA endonuclease YhcR with UshA esterase domain
MTTKFTAAPIRRRLAAAVCAAGAALAFLIASPLRAQESAATQPAAGGGATSQPSSGEPAASSIVDAADKAAIDANMSKEVTVEGIVDTASWSSSGKVLRMEFKGNQQSKLQGVAFEKNKKSLDEAFSGDFVKAMTGAHVRVRGTLKDYRGRPEIVIDSASQVTVLEPSPAASQPAQ